jgi:hypothetical protein
MAQDRLLVAEQRRLNVEQRRSASYIQLLDFEQKQLQKRAQTYAQSSPSMIRRCSYSTSDPNISRTCSTNDVLTTINHNILFLPKIDDIARRFSACFIDEFDHSSTYRRQNDKLDDTSGNNKKMHVHINGMPLPLLTVIPPDDDDM